MTAKDITVTIPDGALPGAVVGSLIGAGAAGAISALSWVASGFGFNATGPVFVPVAKWTVPSGAVIGGLIGSLFG